MLFNRVHGLHLEGRYKCKGYINLAVFDCCDVMHLFNKVVKILVRIRVCTD